MKLEETELYRFYLKKMNIPSAKPKSVRTTAQFLLETFDVFFFDAFGTLYNRNGFVYPFAREFLQSLRDAKKEIRLLTNAAHDTEELSKDLKEMGFLIEPQEIFSSGGFFRDFAKENCIQSAYFLGRTSGKILLEKANVTLSESIETSTVVICSTELNKERLVFAEKLLSKPNSLLVVLNPDACAPEIDGSRSDVSGLQAFRLMKKTGCRTEFFGKPFVDVFEKAKKSLVSSGKIVMVGDTLGTDVVGAKKANVSSCLVMGRNMREETFQEDCDALGFAPDYIISGF